MKRRQFLQSAAAAMAAPKSAPPNLVFIMPDQWRGMALGCAGNEQVRTPNLDRLASEGVQFTNTTANCPVCTPARGILLTGKYPHATGTGVNDVLLPLGEPTIAKALSASGYYTGFVGKWHLEGGKRMPGFVPPGPHRQGFQFWAANICSHDYLHQQYFRDDPAPLKISGYDAPGWTDLAIEFLEKATHPGRPFCLFLEYPTPHNPYLLAPGFETAHDPAKIRLRKNWKPSLPKLSAPADIAGYYSAIDCLDRHIGRLLAKLDKLGARDNTIVVFTSDHGDMLGSHGTVLKRKPWEESVLVPGIVRWPAALKAGRKSDAMLSHVDMVPTLLGLCGVRPQGAMHGFDYSGYLLGRQERTPEFSHLMIYTQTENNEFGPWRGLRSRQYKYARFQDKPWVLYDLEKDPFEMENLVEKPSSSQLVKKFDREIVAVMERTGDRWEEQKDAAYR
jgi:arylsulfatase A-like enzyme